jgi:hypothetical protein
MPCQGRTVTSVTGLLHVSPSAAPHFLLSANQSIHPLRAASICLTIRLPIIRQGKGGLSCFDDYCIDVCDESRGGCLPAWQSPTTCMVALPCHGTSVLSDPSRLAIVSSSQHERAGLRVTAYDRLSVPVIQEVRSCMHPDLEQEERAFANTAKRKPTTHESEILEA